jgi:hypothetical protein
VSAEHHGKAKGRIKPLSWTVLFYMYIPVAGSLLHYNIALQIAASCIVSLHSRYCCWTEKIAAVKFLLHCCHIMNELGVVLAHDAENMVINCLCFC